MKIRKLSLTFACAFGVSLAQVGYSNTISVNGGGALTGLGINYLNFDNLTIPGYGSQNISADCLLTINQDAQVAQGSESGKYAAPFLSGNNGANFAYPSTIPGQDTTKYLTSGKTPGTGGSIEFQFASAHNYFGLLWGSVDTYNTLSFYKGNTLQDTVTGSAVWNAANGDQGVQGTWYVNITGLNYDKVIVTSDQYAFELDNVAYGTVPDGGMALSLLGFALVGVEGLRRRLSK